MKVLALAIASFACASCHGPSSAALANEPKDSVVDAAPTAPRDDCFDFDGHLNGGLHCVRVDLASGAVTKLAHRPAHEGASATTCDGSMVVGARTLTIRCVDHPHVNDGLRPTDVSIEVSTTTGSKQSLAIDHYEHLWESLRVSIAPVGADTVDVTIAYGFPPK